MGSRIERDELPRAYRQITLDEPAQLPEAQVEKTIGQFRHTIVNTKYCFQVLQGSVPGTPDGFSYLTKELLDEVPLSTTAKKALACLPNQGLLTDVADVDS